MPWRDRCIAACPTDALDPARPYTLHANRCIAYLTIEHDGPIPLDLREAMGNRVFGCDDCLDVCPFNRFGPATKEPWFLPREALADPRLADFADLDEARFREIFSQSAVKRSGLARFHRNLAVALGNWRVAEALPPLIALLNSPHSLVRAHAAWALGRVPGGPTLLQTALNEEKEQSVLDEIKAALAAQTTPP